MAAKLNPYIIGSSNFLKRLPGGDSLGNYLSSGTAGKMKSMMKNDVLRLHMER